MPGVVLRARCVLDGRAYRPGRERREVRTQASRPRQGRAAHGRLSQDPPARPGAALRLDDGEPLAENTAIHPISASASACGRAAARAKPRRSRQSASSPRACIRRTPMSAGPSATPPTSPLSRHQGGGAEDLPRLSQADRRHAGGTGVARRQVFGARSLWLRFLHLGSTPRAADGRAQELHGAQGPHAQAPAVQRVVADEKVKV